MLNTYERIYEEYISSFPDAYKFTNMREVEEILFKSGDSAKMLLAKLIYPVQKQMRYFCFMIKNDENYSKIMKPARFYISSTFRTGSPSHGDYKAFDISADNIPQIYYFYTFLRMLNQKTKLPYHFALSMHNWHIHFDYNMPGRSGATLEFKNDKGNYHFETYSDSYLRQIREKYQCKTTEDYKNGFFKWLPSARFLWLFPLIILILIFFKIRR